MKPRTCLDFESIQHWSVNERKNRRFRNSDGKSLWKREYKELVARKNRTYLASPAATRLDVMNRKKPAAFN
jgi:hypothetical protein